MTEERITVANQAEQKAKQAQAESARYQNSIADQITSLEATRKAIELNQIALEATKTDIEMEKAAVLAIQISAQQTEQAAAEGWSCVLKAVRQLHVARSKAEIAKAEAIEATRQLNSERQLPGPRTNKTASPNKTKQSGNSNAGKTTKAEVEVARKKR